MSQSTSFKEKKERLQHWDEDDDCSDNDDGDVAHGSDLGAEEVKIIAKKETKVVLCLKIVVSVVLAASALGVAFWTYHHVSTSEMSQFNAKFADDADKIFDSIGSSLDRTLGVFDSLSVTFMSYARSTDAQWPFVTLPFFGVRLAKLLALSNSLFISISPLVQPQQRSRWEAYQAENNQWVNETIAVLAQWNDHNWYFPPDWETNPAIYGDVGVIPYNETRAFLPQWQNFPVIPSPGYSVYNFDWMSVADVESPVTCLEKHQAVLSPAYMIPAPDNPAKQAETEAWVAWFQKFLPSTEDPREPASDIFYPLVDDISQVELADGSVDYDPSEHKIVGAIVATMRWREMLKNILPEDSNGIDVVFKNPCTLAFTYRIYGPGTKYRGVGDLHDTRYDHMGKVADLVDLGRSSSEVYTGLPVNTERCPFTISLFPSQEMESIHTTSNRITFTVIAVLIFGFTALVFCLYDTTVERRQKIVMHNAIRSSAIVSSLFPEDVRERIYGSGEQEETNPKGNLTLYGNKYKGAQSFDVSAGKNGLFLGAPIADLYPDTTVLFADIAGFTAWSSERQAVQVFCLLETVYHAFDVIAKHRGVFKVETIGDSYVAVVGLPTPKDLHAVIMARFARDIRNRMVEVVTELEKSLGPGTGDLALRIGLNSGPTTGGVLRGEKSRFQLFGDTVNTAARMESNGERNKIQISQKTADLLVVAGKGHWVTPRSDKINAKGKGMMQTFWCEPKTGGDSRAESSQSGGDQESVGINDETIEEEDRVARLLDWHVDLLLGVLKDKRNRNVDEAKRVASSRLVAPISTDMPRDEVGNLVLPENISKLSTENSSPVAITPLVQEQLRELVERIAQKYTSSNAFHTFAHCSHVVLSVKKLLDNLVTTEDAAKSQKDAYFMVTNPLVQFAVLFAALIHDVDHPGVSNAQQVKEQTAVAIAFAGQSVAEQHSFTTAWAMLMEPKYSDLQSALFSSADDMTLFRQVVVNAVLATDLFDAQLKAVREERWRQARWNKGGMDNDVNDDCKLSSPRASSIIDLIVQLSDVAHTMQHFTIYKKWNVRLLDEMSAAFRHGRADRNPATSWYDGELWFFDNYVIPLAQKLKACGMFGVLGDEFLAYAQDNRIEWEATGRDIVLEATKDQLPVISNGLIEM